MLRRPLIRMGAPEYFFMYFSHFEGRSSPRWQMSQFTGGEAGTSWGNSWRCRRKRAAD